MVVMEIVRSGEADLQRVASLFGVSWLNCRAELARQGQDLGPEPRTVARNMHSVPPVMMTKQWTELPLTFRGHIARVIAKGDDRDGWDVCTEVDGRQMGWEHYPVWSLVEQFRGRMQRWLTHAESAERASAA